MNRPSRLIDAFTALLLRDVVLAYRLRSETVSPLIFFIIVVSLFPLAVSPSPDNLRVLAPGVIWVAALLAALLSLESLFRLDFDDGTLEQLLLSPHPAAILVLAKVLAHWLVTGLPLMLLGPMLAMLLYLPTDASLTLMVSLALGTPVLSLAGAIGMALTVGLRRGGVLIALLVLPCYVPVLIFGANAVHAAMFGLDAAGQLYLLAALLALAVALAPLATAAALEISAS
jgi:heme exporter protein B